MKKISIRTSVKYYKRKLLKQPVVIVDLLKEFVGDGETRHCPVCKEITPLEDWLVKEWIGLDEADIDYCPLCYTVCEGEDCDAITHTNVNVVECMEFAAQEKTLCEVCYEINAFHCDGCDSDGEETKKCNCDYCTNQQCDECGDIHCDDCLNDGSMYWCAGCDTFYCCRKFYAIEDGELYCAKCVKEVIPSGMISNC